MSKKVSISLLFAATAVAVMAVFAGCGDNGQVQTSGSGLETETREVGGVTINVTPQNPEGSESWTFNVVFDTHTVELGQEPVQISTLTADGKEYAPTAWEGDPPGGHHIEGTLKFPAISPRPKNIELTIREVGGADSSFSWILN